MENEHFIRSVEDYINWTETVAVYPRQDNDKAKDYEFLGVISEIGEVCGMLKRELRDPDYTLERISLKKELGDIAWYLARLHYEHNSEDNEGMLKLMDELNIERAASCNCFSVAYDVFKYFRPLSNTRSAVVEAILGHSDVIVLEQGADFPKVLHNAFKKLNEMDAELHGRNQLIMQFSQYYEESIGKFMVEFVDDLRSSLGLVRFYILCDRFRFEPMDVLRTNYRKLEDSKERNVIHGQGDAR